MTNRRLTWVALCLGLIGAAGATCIIDDAREQPVGTSFGVAVSRPSTTRTVARGSHVGITWSLSNLTGEDATIIILVEERIGPKRTELTRLTIGSTTSRGDFTWDTTSFVSGDYAVVVRAETPSRSTEAGSLGRIFINEPPSFRFTRPEETTAVPEGGVLPITWTASDVNADGTVDLLLDLDLEHESGNEIAILRGRRLPGAEGNDVFDFAGTDVNGNPVPFGTYSLFARVRDAVNEELVVEADAQIITDNAAPSFTFTLPNDIVEVTSGEPIEIAWTVSDAERDPVFVTILYDDDNQNDTNDPTPPTVIVSRQRDDDGSGTASWDTTDVAAGTYQIQARFTDDINAEGFTVARFNVAILNAAPELTFTAPTGNEDFLATEPTLAIAFRVEDPDNDVLVDLKIDTDDNHANGNEITILSQRLVSKGVSDQTFDWDGNDSDGNAVPDGIYTLFSVTNDGERTPVTNTTTALIFRRSSADMPLIGFLDPEENSTINPGAFLNIRWRDDDPTGGATIRIVLDDDAAPNQIAETGKPEIQILGGRDASGDGILDRFAYQVQNLDPGTYYIHAYITAGLQSTATAQGRIIIPDPAAR